MASEGNAYNVDRDLIRKRATIKTKLSTFKKFVSAIHESEEIPMDQLKLRIAQIEHDFTTFNSIQEALELNADDNSFEARLNERETFESNYYELLATAKRIEREHDKSRGQVDPSTFTDNQFPYGPHPSGSNDRAFTLQSPFTMASELQVKLPNMHLPRFGGSYEAWPSFSDTFRAAIHDNPNFRDVQKLIYLKSCLTGKAAEKVESLETTSVNYSVAWNILERHYNDPSIVINNRIQAFFELPTCSQLNSSALCELTDAAMKHYNALKALNKPFLEAFPIYAITSKLDEQTRLRWKEKTQGSGPPTMEQLLDFLHNRCRVLETSKIEPTRSVIRSQTNTNMFNRQTSNPNIRALAHPSQQARCFMCKGNHFTQYCEKLTNASIDQRAEMVRNAGLCFNCLRSNHDINACTAGSCKRCDERHHTLLHKESSPVQSAVSSLNANIGNETLLSTAIVHVQDRKGLLHPCRVLLDSGSQSHFMTKRFATKLALPQCKGNIPVVGINHSITQTMNTTRATIRSRINNFSADLTFLILPNITEILPSHPIPKTRLQIPSNIPLADPNFNNPTEVDALIGAEIFFKLLCIGQITIANSSITAQKTKLGWVLAGTVANTKSLSTTRCHVVRNLSDDRGSKLREIEKAPQEIILSHEERACEPHDTQNITRDLSTRNWPTSKLDIVRIPELRPVVSLSMHLRDFGFIERFSSFHRLKRVVTYMLRFKQSSSKRASLSGPLTTIELRKSQQRVVMLVQQQAYRREISAIKSTNRSSSSNLSSLSPFLDADGMLRVGGRLSKSKLSYGEKHPILSSKKHHLTRVMGDTLLSFEGLLTLAAPVESILNTLPLTSVSTDPNDLTAITSSHFQISESMNSVPDHDHTSLPDGRLSSWQHKQKIKAHFWKRWRNAYLQELTVRKKCHTNEAADLPIGTTVLVQEDNTPPMQWPLGRVTAIHPGEDGVIRVVTVRTSRGEYKRSVKRLAPLPVD